MAIAFSSTNSQACSSAKAAGLEIDGGKIRLVPPVAKSSAAYVKIKNTSKKDIYLEDVEIKNALTAELHDMKHENGMMKMRKVDRILIKAGSTTKLTQGGLHIMLFGLKEPLEAGKKYETLLKFSNNTKITLDFKVESL
jgi:copper(I)-binding protein